MSTETETQGAHEGAIMPEGVEAPPPGTPAMRVLRWLLVVALAAVAAASLAYGFGWLAPGAAQATRYHCPMHPTVIQDHPGECPICGMDLVVVDGSAGAPAKAPPAKASPVPAAAAGRYTCPMHPSVVSDQPGRCPECKMFLVATGGAATAAPEGLAAVDLPPDRVQLLGMRTAKVVRAPLSGELRAVGYVAAPEGGLGHVHARSAGWLEQVLATDVGRRVERGQVLALLYGPDLVQAQQDLLSALRWSATSGEERGRADGLAAAARRRLEVLGFSPEDVADLERSGQPSRTVRIRAPMSGHLVARTAIQGLYVQPDTELFQIADLSTVWVLLDLFERDLSRVRVGQAVQIAVSASPGKALRGRIELLYPTVVPETRTVRARVVLGNPGGLLRPGMLASAVVEVGRAEGLVVPAEALVDTGEQQYVFVVHGEGRFEPRRVEVGLRAGEQVQLRAGVAEGETVVTTANFLIDSESRLRAALEQFGARDGGR